MNKSDEIQASDKKKFYEEKFDFILSHLRQIAIEYGASIIYTSAKSNCNLKLLYQYICHILFNFQLSNKPNLIDKEAIFIPSGSDDLSQLNEDISLSEYLTKSFEKEIETPISKKNIVTEGDVVCEDTNAFLKEIKIKTGHIEKSLRSSLPSSSFAPRNKNMAIGETNNFYTNAIVGD